MASAALPFFFPAVEVDGELVWRRRHPAHRAALAGRSSWRDAASSPSRPATRARARRQTGRRSPAIRRPRRWRACCTTPSSSISSMATRWRCSGSTISLPACRRPARRPAAHRSAAAAALDRSRTARERLRARAAAPLPVSRARARHARDAVERHAQPGDVSERLRPTAHRARRSRCGGENRRHSPVPGGPSNDSSTAHNLTPGAVSSSARLQAFPIAAS